MAEGRAGAEKHQTETLAGRAPLLDSTAVSGSAGAETHQAMTANHKSVVSKSHFGSVGLSTTALYINVGIYVVSRLRW